MRTVLGWLPRVVAVLVVVGLLVALGGRDSSAVPAFARKYRTSCSTCHVSFPKLNAFGEAFRLGGYQVPGGDEAFIKEEPVPLGAEAWKRVFPEGIWPSGIPGTSPLAVRATGAFVADLRGIGGHGAGTEAGTYNFLFPAAFNLYAAGTLAEDISFWGAVHVFQGSEWGTLGKLHVTFTNLADAWVPQHLFNVRVGQFVPAALAFDHHRNMTFATPLVATANAVDGVPFGIGHVHGSGGSHGGTHAHGNGEETTFTGAYAMGNAQVGAELFGLLGSRVEYVAGLVDGSPGAVARNSDKGFYGRMRVKAGGIAFDGTSAKEGEKDDGEPKLIERGAWTDNSVVVGATAYWGRHRMQASRTEGHPLVDSLGNLVVLDDGDAATVMETETSEHVNEVLRAGADVQLNLGDFELLTMAVWGTDSDVRGDGSEVSTVMGMSQLDWVTPWSFLIPSLRFEAAWFFGDQAALVPADARQAVVSLTMLARANVRLQLEGHVDLIREESGEEKDYGALILDASF